MNHEISLKRKSVLCNSWQNDRFFVTTVEDSNSRRCFWLPTRSGADWPPLRLSLALTPKPINMCGSPHVWHRYINQKKQRLRICMEVIESQEDTVWYAKTLVTRPVPSSFTSSRLNPVV